MLHIGCHLSASKGYLAMGREALSLGADTLQYFSRNPRGGNARVFDESDAGALAAFMQEHAFAPIIAHAPYTLNPCAARPEVLDFARRALNEDLARLEFLPGALYNLHPGSHVGQGVSRGIERIAETLNLAVPESTRATVLLETMAGKGSEIGGTFEELRAILDLLHSSDRFGVCMDVCHVSDAGYDLRGDLDGVLTRFDKAIGLSRLKAIHLNDSMNPPGSHKDRHQKIGLGALGAETFQRIVRHPALQSLPFILETPNDLPGYAAEIRMLREWAQT